MAFEEKIAEEFELAEQDGSVLSSARKSAFSSFKKLGIPSNRHEEWRYTRIKPRLPETLSLTNANLAPVSKSQFNRYENVKGTKLVFVNGIFAPKLSEIIDSAEIVAGNLGGRTSDASNYYNKLASKYEEHFSTLNTAFCRDGAFVHFKGNAKNGPPVFIIHLYNAPDTFVQSRTLVIADVGAAGNIIFDFQCIGQTSFINHVSEVFGAKNSALEITQLQTATTGATMVNTLEAEIAGNAVFTCNTVSFEGRLIRNTTNVRLNGQSTEAHLNGLYYAKGDSLIDNHILVDHYAPNCQSNQLYKGIMDDEATGVFNGKIYVKREAQKTNAYQSSKAILLSDNATINSKPQLEIFADDVKCSHGATSGQLNEEEIFYLRARGIEEAEAKGMLTYAFAGQILGKIADENMRTALDNVLKERLNLNF